VLPLLEYVFRRITGLAKNRYVTFSSPKMEAERRFHTTTNFYRKHDFRTDKTVLFTVAVLTHTHTHTPHARTHTHSHTHHTHTHHTHALTHTTHTHTYKWIKHTVQRHLQIIHRDTERRDQSVGERNKTENIITKNQETARIVSF